LSVPFRNTIGETARLVGVSTATLRLWDKEGLIQPTRTESGHRLFSNEEVTHLRRLQYLRNIQGLNFAAIRLELSQEAHSLPEPTPPPSLNEGRELGRKLRIFRNRQKLTLKQIHKQTGLSVSFISAVERGTTGISLTSLLKLTLVYKIHLEDLYEKDSTSNRKLVRTLERQVFDHSLAGVRIEQLTHGPAIMEAQYFVLEPGASSEGAYFHEGEELVFVTSGSVDFYLDENEYYHLEEGDCLYFPSNQSHRWENTSATRTYLLWVDASTVSAGNIRRSTSGIDALRDTKRRR